LLLFNFQVLSVTRTKTATTVQEHTVLYWHTL